MSCIPPDSCAGFSEPCGEGFGGHIPFKAEFFMASHTLDLDVGLQMFLSAALMMIEQGSDL